MTSRFKFRKPSSVSHQHQSSVHESPDKAGAVEGIVTYAALKKVTFLPAILNSIIFSEWRECWWRQKVPKADVHSKVLSPYDIKVQIGLIIMSPGIPTQLRSNAG